MQPADVLVPPDDGDASERTKRLLRRFDQIDGWKRARADDAAAAEAVPTPRAARALKRAESWAAFSTTTCSAAATPRTEAVIERLTGCSLLNVTAGSPGLFSSSRKSPASKLRWAKAEVANAIRKSPRGKSPGGRSAGASPGKSPKRMGARGLARSKSTRYIYHVPLSLALPSPSRSLPLSLSRVCMA